MKNLILVAIVIFSSKTYSQEFRPDGQFHFSGVTTEQVRDIEVVPQSNIDRYYELTKKNYNCELIADFFKCVKHLKGSELPDNYKQQIINQWREKTILFTQSTNSPALLNDAESLTEWKVFDKVNFSGQQAFDYDYLQLKGENSLHKIAIRFPAEDVWAVLESKKTLYLPHSKTITTGRFNFRVYELALYFTGK